MSHLKNNYIFGILESRPTIWHTFVQNSSTFNFRPPYNPMESFWSTVFQNAQWCQSGINLIVCQDMSKSQKHQKYCNSTFFLGGEPVERTSRGYGKVQIELIIANIKYNVDLLKEATITGVHHCTPILCGLSTEDGTATCKDEVKILELSHGGCSTLFL